MTTPASQRIELPLRANAGAIPRLEDHFGLWAYDPDRFFSQLATFNRFDLAGHVRGVQAAAASGGRMADDVVRVNDRDDGQVAVIELQGTLMKHASSVTSSTSTIRARQAIRSAADNPAIGGILLHIDSPGGTVAGTQDLADDVAAANARKPVYAVAEDLCASAAYWVGSQASKLYASNSTTLVGSIGTLLAMYDLSGMAEKEGVEALVFKTGPIKGAGLPGAAITQEQREYFQGLVNSIQPHFDAAVKSGRGMTSAQLDAVKTGGVFLANAAKGKRLIDGIQSADATLRELADAMGKRPGQGASASAAQTMTATQRWQKLVATHMAKGKSQADAIGEARKADPQLHAAYLSEFNAALRSRTRR